MKLSLGQFRKQFRKAMPATPDHTHMITGNDTPALKMSCMMRERQRERGKRRGRGRGREGEKEKERNWSTLL